MSSNTTPRSHQGSTRCHKDTCDTASALPEEKRPGPHQISAQRHKDVCGTATSSNTRRPAHIEAACPCHKDTCDTASALPEEKRLHPHQISAALSSSATPRPHQGSTRRHKDTCDTASAPCSRKALVPTSHQCAVPQKSVWHSHVIQHSAPPTSACDTASALPEEKRSSPHHISTQCHKDDCGAAM